MTVFYLTIVCAHVAACSLPAPVFGHFESENQAMCEQSVSWLVARDGLRDFIVTCSDRKA
jgi:hypothetical protein